MRHDWPVKRGETGGVKFGLSYNTGFAGTDPANLKAIARHADDLGFESFYLPEHVTLYPGAPGRRGRVRA